MHLLASHKFAGRKRGEQKKNELEFHKGARRPQTSSCSAGGKKPSAGRGRVARQPPTLRFTTR